MNMIILFTVPELQSGWVEISVVQLRLHRSYTRSQYSAFKCSESKEAKIQNTTQRYPEGVVNNQNQNHILLIGPGERQETREERQTDSPTEGKTPVQTDGLFDICRQVATCY